MFSLFITLFLIFPLSLDDHTIRLRSTVYAATSQLSYELYTLFEELGDFEAIHDLDKAGGIIRVLRLTDIEVIEQVKGEKPECLKVRVLDGANAGKIIYMKNSDATPNRQRKGG